MTHTARYTAASPRRGFTLLEVILALALSVVVIGAIGMAIDLNLRLLDTARREVEELQLARSILRLIADDLRSTLHYEEIDVAGLLGDASLSGLSASASETADALGDIGGTAPRNSSAGNDAAESLDSASENTSNQDLTSSLSSSSLPGVYGDQYTLQIDISRLPRVDQFLVVPVDGTSALPSEVKTVTWFIAQQAATQPYATTGFTGVPTTGPVLTSGLARRELDRAVSRFSAEQGNFALADQYTQILAPEVYSIEFRYFDGTQWLTTWNTDEMGYLPVAVEVVLTLQAEPAGVSSWLPSWSTPMVDLHAYRLVVHLPASQPGTPADATTATDDTSDNASSSDSGSNTGSSSSAGGGRP